VNSLVFADRPCT